MANPEISKPVVAESLPRKKTAPVETGVAVVLMCVVLFFSWKQPDFRSPDNLRLMSKQIAELAIIATGMTLVISTGGIDMSVGSVMALSGMTLGWLATAGHVNPWFACLGAVLLGGVCGKINGVLITRMKLPPIIVTLAMYAVARALASAFNDNHSISGLPPVLNETFDRTNVAGLPILLWIAIASLVGGAVALKFTSFGRSLLALGGNRTTAFLAGMKTARIETWAYVISGMCAGLAAVINTSLKATATPDTGQFAELNAITAVVLGGTIITGGSATLLGTGLGVLTIISIISGIRLFGQEDQIAWFIVGLALLLAVEVQKRRGA